MRETVIIVVLFASSLAAAQSEGPDRPRSDGFDWLHRFQPSVFVGYNSALGIEGECAVLIGSRSGSGVLYGAGPAIGYSEAGWKIGLGIGMGRMAVGGGGGSLSLRAVHTQTDSNAPGLKEEHDYHGLEILAGVVGPGGSYAGKVGYYRSTDGGDTAWMIGVGIGM